MKKFLLSAFALATVATAANAQGGVELQARAGVNFTNLNGKVMGNKIDGKLKTGFHAGLDAAIPLAPEFYLQPGVLYSVKGAKAENGDMKTNLSYIEVPISFAYKPQLGDGRLILAVGPYVGYAISGKVKDAPILGDYDIDFGNDAGDTKRFDFGGNINFGYEFTRNLFAQINAQLGMANLQAKGNSDNSMKNTGFGLSIGYRF